MRNGSMQRMMISSQNNVHLALLYQLTLMLKQILLTLAKGAFMNTITNMRPGQ